MSRMCLFIGLRLIVESDLCFWKRFRVRFRTRLCDSNSVFIKRPGSTFSELHARNERTIDKSVGWFGFRRNKQRKRMTRFAEDVVVLDVTRVNIAVHESPPPMVLPRR